MENLTASFNSESLSLKKLSQANKKQACCYCLHQSSLIPSSSSPDPPQYSDSDSPVIGAAQLALLVNTVVVVVGRYHNDPSPGVCPCCIT